MKLAERLERRFPEIPCAPDESRPHPHTSVGIEVELENVLRIPHGKRWRTYLNEGSIISGCELISDPVWGTAITDALDELEQLLEGRSYRHSIRTSVHVHVNVLDMEMPQIANLLKLYLTYERSLFRYDQSWDRWNCPFCVPAQVSESILSNLAHNVHVFENDMPSSPQHMGSKYAAMNLNNITTLGTIEFRHLGGTCDKEKISTWINLLLQLKKAAIDGTDPADSAAVWCNLRNRIVVNPMDLRRGLELVRTLPARR